MGNEFSQLVDDFYVTFKEESTCRSWIDSLKPEVKNVHKGSRPGLTPLRERSRLTGSLKSKFDLALRFLSINKSSSGSSGKSDPDSSRKPDKKLLVEWSKDVTAFGNQAPMPLEFYNPNLLGILLRFMNDA